MQGPYHIAVIGAGISGLAFTRSLFLKATARGLKSMLPVVHIYEKAPRCGGRVAARPMKVLPIGNYSQALQDSVSDLMKSGKFNFDRGSPSLRISDPDFKAFLDEQAISSRSSFSISPEVPVTGSYIGVPRMDSIFNRLYHELQWTYSPRRVLLYRDTLAGNVEPTDKPNQHTILSTAATSDWGPLFPKAFNAVISTVPAPQAIPILLGASEPLCELIAPARFHSSFSLMQAYEGAGAAVPPGLNYVEFKGHPVLARAVRQSAKRGIENLDMWVIESTTDYATTDELQDDHEVLSQMEEAFNQFRAVFGTTKAKPFVSHTHRWRYRTPSVPVNEAFLWDPVRNIGACGDWCAAPGSEGLSDADRAWISGTKLGEKVDQQLFGTLLDSRADKKKVSWADPEPSEKAQAGQV